MTIDIEKLEAVLAGDSLAGYTAAYDAAPALISEHRRMAARIAELEGRLSALLQPDGYWFADDREIGHFELDEMLEDTPFCDVVAIVPWRQLPLVFAAFIAIDEDTREWRTFETEQAARAAQANNHD